MPSFWEAMGKVLGQQQATKKGFSQTKLEEIQRKRGKPHEIAFWSGFSKAYGGIGEKRQKASLGRRRELGQLDLSMLSPGMLEIILQQNREKQRKRTKERRHAVIGGMGLAPTGRKTLLGE